MGKNERNGQRTRGKNKGKWKTGGKGRRRKKKRPKGGKNNYSVNGPRFARFPNFLTERHREVKYLPKGYTFISGNARSYRHLDLADEDPRVHAWTFRD